MTPAGKVTLFPLPSTSYSPEHITAGPDGALWFTENSSQIGRITLQGKITEFAVPPYQDEYGRIDSEHPWGITTGPDGHIWFSVENDIGRITPQGAITENPMPAPTGPGIELTTGPNHALWFTQPAGNWIGRIALPVQ